MITKSLAQTTKIAMSLAKSLKGERLILLYGDLGSGKTTFVKGFAEALGIKQFSIKSPTYTYIRHLPFKKGNFYHIDLYRLEEIDNLLLQEIIEILQQKDSLVVIEWADKIHQGLDFSDSIKINFEYQGENSRKITITKPDEVKYLTPMEIKAIYQEFKVPRHIIKHMQQVANMSSKICQLFAENGLKIDSKVVIQAALIHDCLRVCDIRDFHPKTFSKNASVTTISLWLSFREKYSSIGHEKAMANYLHKRGYVRLAKLIAKHGFFEITNLKNYEEKVLYYADKRVDKDKIVSLTKRFSEGRKRNFKPGNDFNSIAATEKKVFQLEKQLSKLLGQDIDKL